MDARLNPPQEKNATTKRSRLTRYVSLLCIKRVDQLKLAPSALYRGRQLRLVSYPPSPPPKTPLPAPTDHSPPPPSGDGARRTVPQLGVSRTAAELLQLAAVGSCSSPAARRPPHVHRPLTACNMHEAGFVCAFLAERPARGGRK